MEDAKFWNRVKGYESGASNEEATNRYRRVARQFDVLKDVPRFYEHANRSAARDLSIIWNLGITHIWIHEQIVRIGGISDLTGAKWVKESGFAGVVKDTAMLMATSQKKYNAQTCGTKGQASF